ncbi:MAG TPA: hypothetical protein VES90_10080 [Candidatus Eisenbacteria bacterium]|nr:hypothetical protein [Candidatus Eisenbacteria bacterium]
MVGAILLVSALIFGALAGGVVVQRLNSMPAASSEQERGEDAGEKSQPKTKTKHPNNGQHETKEQDDSEDKDA